MPVESESVSSLMTTSHRLLNLNEHVLGSLASRLARGWRLDHDDVRQDLYLLLLVDGAKYDPERGALGLWLKWRWYNLNRTRRTLQLVSTETLEHFHFASSAT